jgi:predicted dehydrogenase
VTGRDTVQAAVIGAGAWAPLHVEAIRHTGIGEVAVLVGRDPARVRVAAARLAVEAASVNVRDVLEDPTVDVINWFDAVEFASTQRVEQVHADLAITRADAHWGDSLSPLLTGCRTRRRDGTRRPGRD